MKTNNTTTTPHTPGPYQKYPIVVRRLKRNNAIILFMIDRGCLTCFTYMEGHSRACIEYMHSNTYPANESDSAAHFERYTKDWEGESIPVLRKRLYFKAEGRA